MHRSQMSPRLSRSPKMKAKWLANTLAYQYGHSKPSKNELIVLSSDLDQYLQEIFFSLDSQGNGKISSQDFKILCDILYMRDDSVLSGLADELDFADFHDKLCEHFACYGDFTGFLVNRNFRAVNTSSDNLRRATKFQKKLALQHTHRCMHNTEIFKNWDKLRLSGFRLSEIKEHIDALLFEVAYHKEESQSLKEIIEDLRSLLQSSDAQNLALKVAVKKMHYLVAQDADKTCKSIKRLSLPINNTSYKPMKGEERSIRKLARELTELRALRDKEVNELILFNSQLQYDLTDMSREICRLEDENRKVQKHMEAIIDMYAHCRQLFSVCVESFREVERSQEERSQEPKSGYIDEEMR
ncbi:hypothetical protein CHS0354_015735 [Potamilus streckersoni]|uniref:EF-hand domain-containing protein n=1 Tax=Potamilus streckersoni TaxID=2493646 RepID=A0AAE0TJ14_9BIVA|nr:hypothetical protein CHS0354_015735 [Potamilus streckersoni]